VTTATTHRTRTRHRDDRDDRADDGNAAERAAAGALVAMFAELGSPMSMAEGHELYRRIQRQGIADLFWVAINHAVNVRGRRRGKRGHYADAD